MKLSKQKTLVIFSLPQRRGLGHFAFLEPGLCPLKLVRFTLIEFDFAPLHPGDFALICPLPHQKERRAQGRSAASRNQSVEPELKICH